MAITFQHDNDKDHNQNPEEEQEQHGRRSRTRSPRITQAIIDKDNTRPWTDLSQWPTQYEWIPLSINGTSRFWTILGPEAMYPGTWTIWWYYNEWGNVEYTWISLKNFLYA